MNHTLAQNDEEGKGSPTPLAQDDGEEETITDTLASE
jgi:hypothetical protein